MIDNHLSESKIERDVFVTQRGPRKPSKKVHIVQKVGVNGKMKGGSRHIGRGAPPEQSFGNAALAKKKSFGFLKR